MAEEIDVSAFTGDPAPAQTQAEGGAETGREPAAAWTAQLPREMREDAARFDRLKGFKTIGELAGAYLTGGGEADYSDTNGILERLGAPKEGEKYDWEGDDKVGFSETARKAKLTRAQADAVLDGFVKIEARKDAANLARVKAEAPETGRALVSEFGEAALEWYKKGIRETGAQKELARAGLSSNKAVARALALLGREMSEDCTPMPGSGGAGSPVTLREGARLF